MQNYICSLGVGLLGIGLRNSFVDSDRDANTLLADLNIILRPSLQMIHLKITLRHWRRDKRPIKIGQMYT